MKDIDRYDEHVKYDPEDEAKREKSKRVRAVLYDAIGFLIKAVILHLATMIVFDLFFTQSVTEMVIDGVAKYKGTLVVFTVFCIVLLAFIASVIHSDNNESRREFLSMMKEKSFTPALFWELSKREIIIYTVTYLAFQIPFCIFYHILGFYFLSPTFFEGLYIMELGFMELTGIGVVGTLINTVLFALVYSFIRFMTYAGWNKDR